jgi:type III secretory pathway component EscV
VSPAIEQIVETAIEHGEQNSHLTLAPQAIRDILHRMTQQAGHPEAAVIAVTSSGSRYFLRQMAEHSISNLFFISNNEIPADAMATTTQPQIRVKSYFASSIPEAIDLVRRELGADALLLNTGKRLRRPGT